MKMSLFTHREFDEVTQQCLGCAQLFNRLLEKVIWKGNVATPVCSEAKNLIILKGRK